MWTQKQLPCFRIKFLHFAATDACITIRKERDKTAILSAGNATNSNGAETVRRLNVQPVESAYHFKRLPHVCSLTFTFIMDNIRRIQQELRDSPCEGDMRSFIKILKKDTNRGIENDGNFFKLFEEIKKEDLFNNDRTFIFLGHNNSKLKLCEKCNRITPAMTTYLCDNPDCRANYCLVCCDLHAASMLEGLTLICCTVKCMKNLHKQTTEDYRLFCVDCMDFKKDDDHSQH